MSPAFESSSPADAYATRGGITVTRTIETIPIDGAVEPILDALDSRRGALFASSFEYPGRYTRWDIGFVDPPIQLIGRGRSFRLSALNARGLVLLAPLGTTVAELPEVARVSTSGREVFGTLNEPDGRFPEEERSKQPSLFTVLRAVVNLFSSPCDPHLGLYGAFGYDLAFQFEPIRLRLKRPTHQRDLVLYLPDDLVIVDHRREHAERRRYDFDVGGLSTDAYPRDGASWPYRAAERVDRTCDHGRGEFADQVRAAKAAFKRGDLFEVVPGQSFFEPSPAPPSELFRRLRQRNPAPYGFLINLGESEYLVGASPEMYLRVEDERVETCPISGTIARGSDSIVDSARILELLNSEKDAAELTMCTDVDRNDKSRICQPGSVRIIGRRQIEMYSRLIHTVDHVEGRLRDGFDGLDAFLAHAWAVTVTGAPKTWAMQFIEDHEKSSRGWYGGAVGLLGFDGNVNTGLTLRTIQIKDGVAQVRVGSTLLYDSDPDEEERETHTKAAALFDALRRPSSAPADGAEARPRPGLGRRVLLVDHQDSFIHTLANYVRQTGAEVVTLRAGFDHAELDALRPDLVLLSPGPGRPSDFDVSGTIAAALARGLPIFGVCLGLQGLVEHLGGALAVLDYPMHGKPSRIRVLGGRLFEGLPNELTAGRYHSLYAVRDQLPPMLHITAESDDGVIMAIEHTDLPLAAVQFHPESLLSLASDLGLRLIDNVVAKLARSAGAVDR